MRPAGEITGLLDALHGGDETAIARLMPIVYRELRRIAAACFARERSGHTLQPTALVHEMYDRLIKPGRGPWKDRVHFFAIAARVMRQVLVDHARGRHAKKRAAPEGRRGRPDFRAPERVSRLLEIEAALQRLEKLSPRQGRIVELRFFAGLTIRETAQELGLGVTVVKSDWAFAKAWLARELSTGQ